MTDQEKAATFIGWRPCEMVEICPNGWNCRTHMRPDLYYSASIAQAQCWHVVAPDMTKPENYMRALELQPRGYRLQRDFCRIFDLDTDVAIIEAETPLKALAALYDKEHPA